MDSSIHSRLKDILPSGGLVNGPKELERYGRDRSGKSSLPAAVLLPKTTAQVQQIVQLAHEERLPLALRGGGTGLLGGAVAPEGGLVLSLSRMDRILEVSSQNSLAVVQPGVSARRLEKHLEHSGWFYPVDPASWRQSTIGGDVATRAHGLREARHGPIGSYLLGLEVIISPGEIIRCGAKTLKCATGYHLVDLFAGSFGRLGVITQITVKLIPRPPVRQTLRAVLRDLETAAGIAGRLRKSGLQPARLELIGPRAARQGFAKLPGIHIGDGYLLLIELDGAEQEDLDERIDLAGACLQGAAEFQAVSSSSAEDSSSAMSSSSAAAAGRTDEARAWWRSREELLRQLIEAGRPSLLATVRMPVSRLPGFWKQTASILQDRSCEGRFWGHLGEGRWHLLVHLIEQHGDPHEILPAVSRSLEETATAGGGFYLPPAALGWTPRDVLVARHDSGQKRLWKALKNRFDPLELFGPID